MLQDTSACPFFLTQLPSFQGSLPCASPSIQPYLFLVPQHQSTPAAVMTARRCQQSSPLSSIKVGFGSERLDRETSGCEALAGSKCIAPPPPLSQSAESGSTEPVLTALQKEQEIQHFLLVPKLRVTAKGTGKGTQEWVGC